VSKSVDGDHFSISELSGLKRLQRSEKHLFLYGSSVLENILLLDLLFYKPKDSYDFYLSQGHNPKWDRD